MNDSEDLSARLRAWEQAFRASSAPRPCVHDWRLIDETLAGYTVKHQPGAPGYGSAYSRGPTVRRWYCTRCRTIEAITDE